MSKWKSIGYTNDSIFKMDSPTWTITPIPEPTPTEPHRTSLKKKSWGYEYTDSDYDRFLIKLIMSPDEDIFYVNVAYYKTDTSFELGTISLKDDRDRDILSTPRLYTLANRDEFTLAFDAVDALFEEIVDVESD